MENKQEVIEKAVREILLAMGEDPDRLDLKDTPRRFAKYMLHFSSIKEAPKITTFEAKSNGLIIVTGLEVRSMCSHHLAPFFGTATVAYYPDKKKAGLSKFQRALDYLANRLQDQEALTNGLLMFLVNNIEPLGMVVKIEAAHTCMTVRGVQCHEAKTITMEKSGICTNPEYLKEILENLK